MPYQDMTRAELESYRPAQYKEPDFERYWAETLDELRAEPPRIGIDEFQYPVDDVTIGRAVYNGFGGAEIGGWLLVPKRPDPVPGLVFYHGYGWQRSEPCDFLGWALQGYAVYAVDVRGQTGYSGDPAPYPGGHAAGHMTQGILDPRGYYYRYVYADAVRAVDALASLPQVDRTRIGVAGSSQGGGLSLAVAALHGSVRTAMAGVPFLSHFRRAIEVADDGPYEEIVTFLRFHRRDEDAAFRTLSYVDTLNLADRVTCPTLVTVGLRDPICPPSTVYAVYHALRAIEKRLDVYPYEDHDVSLGSIDAQVYWAAAHLKQ